MKTNVKALGLLTLLAVNLRMFDVTLNTNTTATSSLSAEMKTYYDKNIIRNAKPNLVHAQFGQKKPIPKNSGKIIEFRKFLPLAKATTPLTEGVSPAGGTPEVTTITATVSQYGYFLAISDLLQMTAIDNNLVEYGIILGDQAGRTIDSIIAAILNAGTNVQYYDGTIAARYLLAGGESSGNHYLTSAATKNAVRTLKRNNAPRIKGDFIGIIHTDVAHDLTNDSAWTDVKKYSDPKDLYEGEIGKLHGVRYVETTEAQKFHAEDLVASGDNATRNLTMASLSTKTFTIDEALATADATALVGRKVIIKGYKYTIASAAAGTAGNATITVSETVSGSPTDGEVIYPGEAGAKGRDVYSTLILGANAYGVTEIEGGGLRNIVKQLGSGGTADPLDQRATTGWKATVTAERLVEEYMVRIETTISA